MFANVGHGTLHDSDYPGAGGWHREPWSKPTPAPNREIMQMDAGLGAVTAILELLVQCRGDMIHILPAIPRRWRSLKFDGIRTEGAFLVGATVSDGRIAEVRVRSLVGGKLRLACGGRIIDRQTKPGQKLTLRYAR